MSKPKWTPGPWEADLADADEQENISIEVDGSHIATVFNAEEFTCLEDDERPAVDVMARATARLIAAAPCIYKTADAFQVEADAVLSGEISREWADHYGPLFEKLSDLRDALAKARGEV